MEQGRQLRKVMSHFVTGVTVIAARDPETGVPGGLTANAVCSVSLDPPLLLVCVSEGCRTHDVIEKARSFSVNVLGESQEEISRLFADGERTGKFDGVGFRSGETGAPILTAALAWLECRVWASYPGGDHTIFVGEVLGSGLADHRQAPLVFFKGRYDGLASGLPVEALVPSGG
jgi:flavin reductase (DIM6/NTAB) family NADH-FMN oxidoreductase RutF